MKDQPSTSNRRRLIKVGVERCADHLLDDLELVLANDGAAAREMKIKRIQWAAVGRQYTDEERSALMRLGVTP